jgi:hypothetical protein
MKAISETDTLNIPHIQQKNFTTDLIIPGHCTTKLKNKGNVIMG